MQRYLRQSCFSKDFSLLSVSLIAIIAEINREMEVNEIMYRIAKKQKLNATVTLMEIEAPLIAKKAEPGQFIILRVNEDPHDAER